MNESDNSASPAKRVAIIGGGISGIAAAWRLSRCDNTKVTLIESSDRLGGVLQTHYEKDYLIERSADNFATLIPDALDLCRATGYESNLIRPAEEGRQAFVLNRGRILPIPAGFSLMQPTRIWSILTTQTLSWPGKFRLGREWLVPPRKDSSDESLESFAIRRLGRETYENLVEPIVSGIFTADPKTLSMQATMPQFVEMERTAGGLIRGHLANRKQGAKQAARRASGARYDQFVAPRDGMSHWIQYLSQKLSGVSIQLNTSVDSVSWNSADSTWQLSTSSGKHSFDALVIAASTNSSARLLQAVNPVFSDELNAIPYASSVVVAMIIDKTELLRRTDGFGLIVPRKEAKHTLAISFSSNKYAGRTPSNQLLLRIFLGGALEPQMIDESEARVQELAEQELRDILGWTGSGLQWSATMRWPNAMPQYLVGHLDRIKRIDLALEAHPTLALCGAGFRGVGIPQCVRSGNSAADRIAAALASKR